MDRGAVVSGSLADLTSNAGQKAEVTGREVIPGDYRCSGLRAQLADVVYLGQKWRPEFDALDAAMKRAPGKPLKAWDGFGYLERPSGADLERLYPRRAQLDNKMGRTVLECRVDATSKFVCGLISEDPPGYGFGAAALRVVEKFRAQPTTATSEKTEGRYKCIPVVWKLTG